MTAASLRSTSFDTTASHSALLMPRRQAIGAAHVVTDAGGMAEQLTGDRGPYSGTASAFLRPGTTQESRKLSEGLPWCKEAGNPPESNTGLVGGGVPEGGIVLTADGLNRIRSVDATNATMTDKAGCILATIQQAAGKVDTLFPLSLASERPCQIGGNLSTDAGGTAVLLYGNTRNLVLGIGGVLPNDRVLNDLYRLRRNNTCSDLRNLFIGASRIP